MVQQIQYNVYGGTAAANYSSSSTSDPESFIEMIRKTSIIIKNDEDICEVVDED